MKKHTVRIPLIMLLTILLSGCSTAGDKTADLSIIYGISTFLSLMLLVGCYYIVRKKSPWLLLLFFSVLIVNTGYFTLSVSMSLDSALFANRVAYLGSVFLPLSMLMSILGVTKIKYSKWIPITLICISIVVFLIAASPGYSCIYYKEVTFSRVNGVSVLNKVYGPLHGLYLVYLLGYFTAMVSVIIYTAIKDKIDSTGYAVMLAIAVFVNIGVWLIEQFVRVDFEILSVSYIISELFLLGLHLLLSETEKQKALLLKQALESMNSLNSNDTIPTSPNAISRDEIEFFVSGITRLTPKERELYECYTAGMSTTETMEHLHIKENTLKFHNKNLYSKLGVKSRKQLITLHKIVASD